MIDNNNKIIGLIMVGFLVFIISFTPVSAVDWPMFHQNTHNTGFLVQPGDFAPKL